MSPHSSRPKILLHCCCAPCTFYPVERSREKGFLPILYWDNPHIHPLKEYMKRFQGVKRFSEEENLSLDTVHNYELQEFLGWVKTLPNSQERCYTCYRSRLERTFKRARELSIHAVTTTLLISPMQDHQYLKETGKKLSEDFNIDFIYEDFRTGFEKGLNKARGNGYYLQAYCGCILSEYERYRKKYQRLRERS